MSYPGLSKYLFCPLYAPPPLGFRPTTRLIGVEEAVGLAMWFIINLGEVVGESVHGRPSCEDPLADPYVLQLHSPEPFAAPSPQRRDRDPFPAGRHVPRNACHTPGGPGLILGFDVPVSVEPPMKTGSLLPSPARGYKDRGMRAILGIDAAWTQREPTGVALIHGEGSTWSIASVAPSYESFVACGQGVPVDWRAAKFGGNWPKLPEVINAARQITTADLCVVAVDMPIATVPFESRRAADSAISRAFGGRGCSAHSPNATRPGALGAGLMGQLNADDFPLATTSHRSGDPPCTIEVYPHPALLALLSRDYRVPYSSK